MVYIHCGNGWCVFQISYWKVWELQTDEQREGLKVSPAEGICCIIHTIYYPYKYKSIPFISEPCLELWNFTGAELFRGLNVHTVFVESSSTSSATPSVLAQSPPSSKAGKRALNPLLQEFALFDLWWKQAQVSQKMYFHLWEWGNCD